jgi:hypothetical protein
MDSLEECGIRWLTASAIETWREAPAVWAMGALYGMKTPLSPAYVRTIAVRDGVRAWLYKANLGEAENLVLENFEVGCAIRGIDIASEEARREHGNILEHLALSVNAFQELGLGAASGNLPLSCSLPTSVMVSGLEVPLLSVPDYGFNDCTVKLKIGRNCYTKVQPRDLTAAAIDFHNRRRPVTVIYVTDKKYNPVRVMQEQIDEAWVGIVMECFALQNLVKFSNSREQLLSMLPVNPNQFRWKSDLLQSAGDILGITSERLNAINSPKTAELPVRTRRDVLGDVLSGGGSWDAGEDV